MFVLCKIHLYLVLPIFFFFFFFLMKKIYFCKEIGTSKFLTLYWHSVCEGEMLQYCESSWPKTILVSITKQKITKTRIIFLKSSLVRNSFNVFWFWYTFVVNVALLDFKNQVFQFSNKLHSFILIGDAWATRVILWRICWNYRRPVYYSHYHCVTFQISRAIYGNDIVRRIELNHRHCVALLAPMLITVILVHIGLESQSNESLTS